MKIEILAIGSELLDGSRQDTNADWIAVRLFRAGHEVSGRTIVGDDVPGILHALVAARFRAEVVILTGGLGPTEDDRTREALAELLAAPLERDPEMLSRLRARMPHLRGSQERMADRPRGASWIPNPVGSAAGLDCPHGTGRLLALPGVPAEMKPMFEETVLPGLRRGGEEGARRSLHIAGRTESSVDEQLRDLYRGHPGQVTILAGGDGIELILSDAGAPREQLEQRLDELETRIRERLGDDLFGRDATGLPQVVGQLLFAAGATVSVAESCTSGMLAARITEVPGSSAWFRGGFVVYDNTLKRDLVGVPESTLRQDGAVSEAVAMALAEGAVRRCATDYGLGVTGIAGPGGGTETKPVGLVFLALAGPGGTEAWRLRAYGDRALVRRRAVTSALDRLRRRLLAQSRSS